MKFLIVSDIPNMAGAKTAEDRNKVGQGVVDGLKLIAKAKKGRLGEHEVWIDGSLYLAVLNDDVATTIKSVVERAGMKVSEMSAEDVFLKRFPAMKSE